MALRQIRTQEDEVLRKKCKIVNEINDRLLTLIKDMKETMYESNGVGLAAPQVGILKRVVVVDIGEGPIVLINPEILESKGEVVDLEGCLSIPNEHGKVRRPQYVKVKAMNEDGEWFTIEGEDFLARAFCHEIDHLDGVLYIDKIEM
ncbi:peptide deformylase [Clostridium senegalense]|uniref:peptide deformylase n=1 Tax=Clostridium senegalense TaxID=1465809 RepID=UPI0002883AFD|nr:peptide deformylase [Clostridium senegalense]MBU5225598.1 peptide deformylase [Clostridium senegalense]